jgi:protein TonB
MFNNLIESCNHSENYKRKGSFFLATTAIYAVFLASAGIASVFAYDAHLENQSLELVSLLTPVPVDKQDAPKPQPAKQIKNSGPKEAQRTELIARVDNPYKLPETVSSIKSKTPEVPVNIPVRIGTTNYDPDPSDVGSPTGSNTTDNNTVSNNKPLVIEDTPPPIVKKPDPPKVPPLVSKGVVNGIAKHLQTPNYPQIAKAAGIKGQVKVQVLIDENGKVVSANVVSGHPLLSAAALQAAKQSSFTPTKLSDVPVKVSGFILYNFTF